MQFIFYGTEILGTPRTIPLDIITFMLEKCKWSNVQNSIYSSHGTTLTTPAVKQVQVANLIGFYDA